MYQRKDRWSVGQWMTPNPQTILPSTSVRRAFFKMRIEGFRHLLVADGDNLVGIVSDRDLRRPDISSEPEGWLDYYNLDEDFEVRFVMTTQLKTVRSSDPLEKALKLMLFHKINALPVLNKKEQLVGILSSQDLMSAFAAALEDYGQVMRNGDAN